MNESQCECFQLRNWEMFDTSGSMAAPIIFLNIKLVMVNGEIWSVVNIGLATVISGSASIL